MRLSSTICVMASSSVRLRTIQGHIRISGKLAGLLAAVAGHDLIAAILTGRTIAGWVTPFVLDAGHHSPHFFIVSDFKGMVLEGVELVQLDIDDLLLAPAWCILRLLGPFGAEAACTVGAAFFSGSFLTAFSGFCAGALGFGAAALSLSAFGGRPRRFGCSGSLGFFLRFLRSLRLLFRFFRFCRVRLFHAGSCRPFLGFLFLHNFSEVIDRNLWGLYLWFRLFFRLGETETFSGSFWGAGGVSLPGPLSVTGCSGVFVVLSSAISIYLPVFGMKKGAQLFSQAPWEVPPFSAMIQKYRRSLVWRYFV